MAFTAKTDWKDGDKLAAVDVNRIEAGIAAKAAKGDKGDPGPKGDKGEPGADAVLPFTEDEVAALKALVADPV